MLFDLDNFKDINDTHGHLEGDRICRLLEEGQSLSPGSTNSRVSEEMNSWPFSPTPILNSLACANRFHEAGRQSQPIAWSVSIGISEWLDEDDSLDALLTRADQALYKSKALGRNRTHAA